MADTKIIFSVNKSSEGGYEARALGQSIFTQAKTMATLRLNAKEAVSAHFGSRKKPPTIRFVKASPRF
jgi:hypothetical protein